MADNPAAVPPTVGRLETSNTGATFQINSSKPLCLGSHFVCKQQNSVSRKNFKEISWNKYRSEIITQLEKNNLII